MTITKKENQILIVSESNNESVKLIKQWLVFYEVNFLSINSDKDEFYISRFYPDKNSFYFLINNQEYLSSDFKLIYIYRGSLKYKYKTGIEVNRKQFDDVQNAFEHFFTTYDLSIKELYKDLIHGISVGKDNGARINKMLSLRNAYNSNLKIPKTIFTSSKAELLKFHESCNEAIITKSLDNNIFYSDEGELYHNLTSSITIDFINKLPDFFPFTIFQENVEKFIELRVFFISDEFKTAAIFSQNNCSTIQDYRNYDDESPNRLIPFNLPDKLKQNLIKFNKLSDIKSGSIDILMTKDEEFYFLEINPQGQYMAVSNYCNFYIEELVANYLSKL